MAIIAREAAFITLKKAASYPLVAITGPRQSGKSTLAKNLFPDKPYVNLEALDVRRFAVEDPRRFLEQYPEGAILDEVQNTPELFSYLQVLVDEKENAKGLFILTGSQQFNLVAKITQSLAGRVGFIQLLPFNFGELRKANWLPDTLEEMLFNGFYPPIYHKKIEPQFWYADYVTTYIERDIRQLLNVHDLKIFHRFLQLCAGRAGQLLNLTSLGNDCGISHGTVKAWLSVLESSYIIHLLSPYHQNFNKRLTKSPKLYFYDTGLACSLLGIQNAGQLVNYPLRGALFENWIIIELLKNRFNQGLLGNIYFWRDSQGHEVDVLIEQAQQLTAVEMKSGKTINQNYFTELNYWRELTGHHDNWVMYAGNESSDRSQGHVVGWKDIEIFLKRINDMLGTP